MTRTYLDAIQTATAGTTLFAAAETKQLVAIVSGIRLPQSHVELLRESNGLMVFHGYIRLFGVGRLSSRDMVAWNEHDCWKFAWGAERNGFWCFGDTGLGDQFAYRIQDLLDSREPPVYLLNGVCLYDKRAWDSFDQFWMQYLVPSATKPLDELISKAHATCGPLTCNQQVVSVPPAGLAEEADSELMVTDARAAMIINGDVYNQLRAAPRGAELESIDSYKDSQDRERIRLRWRRS